jgi:hypothetical protein
MKPSVKKFKVKVSQRRLVLVGVKNHQKNIPSPIDGENFLQQSEVRYLESLSENSVLGFWKELRGQQPHQNDCNYHSRWGERLFESAKTLLYRVIEVFLTTGFHFAKFLHTVFKTFWNRNFEPTNISQLSHPNNELFFMIDKSILW